MVFTYKGIRYDSLYGGSYRAGQRWYDLYRPNFAIQDSPSKPQANINTTSLNVTSNGVYRAPDGTAYDAVAVSVPGPTLTTLNATANDTYEGQFDRVVVNVPQLATEEIEVESLGTYTAPTNKAYSKVVVKGESNKTITENGDLTGLYENPRIAIPAAREEQVLPTITANGTYTAADDKMFLSVTVNVPEPTVTYKAASQELVFNNFEMEVLG